MKQIFYPQSSKYSVQDYSKLIKDTRTLLDFSSAEMAGALGVSPQAIYYWESKRRKPSMPVIEWCLTVCQLVNCIKQRKLEINWQGLLLGFGLSGLVDVVLQELNS